MEKIKVSVIFGLQTIQLFRFPQFYVAVSDDETEGDMECLSKCCDWLSRKWKANKFGNLTQDLVISYETLYCSSMSFKMHFLHSHLDSFHVSCDVTRDERGVRSYQHISAMENSYKDKQSAAILADYCWKLIRSALEIQYKRQTKRSLFNSCKFIVVSCFFRAI